MGPHERGPRPPGGSGAHNASTKPSLKLSLCTFCKMLTNIFQSKSKNTRDFLFAETQHTVLDGSYKAHCD